MNAIEVLNSTPKSRQIWYWRTECESANRRLHILPKDHPEWQKWYKQYNNARITLEQLLHTKLKNIWEEEGDGT